MANPVLISWNAVEHLHTPKNREWYYTVGVITLALVVVCIILSQYLTAVFVFLASTLLVMHASRPARIVLHEINDRGLVVNGHLFPFLTLESFWIPHDEFPPKIILKSHKPLSPFIVVYIDEVDPEDVRQVLLKYIAETEHHEPILKHLLERWGF